MTKFLSCFIAVSLFPAVAFAGDAPVIEQLRQDLVGKSFALRLQVAGTACLQDQGMTFPTSRLVDTEIGDNTVRYYLRADRFMNIRHCTYSAGIVPRTTLGGTYINPRWVADMHPAHTMMSIKQVDAKPDHIEFLLTAAGQSGDEAYGKIKLMTGSGYESQTLEQLETNLARVIELPRISNLVQARNAFESTEKEIAALEASLSSGLTARQKVVNATQLLALYDQEPEAAARLNQLAFSPIQVPDTNAKIQTIAKALTAFQVQADKERIETALNLYDAASTQMKGECERLPSADVNTRAELNAQIARVDASRRALIQFESARRDMVSVARPVPQLDEDYSTKCSISCDILSEGFSRKEQAVRAAEAAAADAVRQQQEKEAQLEQDRLRAQQLDRVDEAFRKLKKQKVVLDAKLLTALGGPDENATYSVYRNLLEEMIRNRQEAQTLGSQSAEQEVQALSTQLRKLEQ